MNYTDTQLKQALVKMLPETLLWDDESSQHSTDRPQDEGWGLCWDTGNPVLDTELLHLCWLAEESLTEDEQRDYQIRLYCLFDENWTYEELKDMCFELSWCSTWDMAHATWQQRVIALCKVKGIEIL